MSKPEQFEILILGMERVQVTRMAYGGIGATDCRRRAPVYRGSCPTSTVPSKNEVWSRRSHISCAMRAVGTVTGPVGIDMAKVRQRKREMVEIEIAARTWRTTRRAAPN